MEIKMKGIILSLCWLLIGSALMAQEASDWQLKLGAAYGQGFITENTQTMQVEASFGFEKDNIELRADGVYFLGQQGDRERFSVNNQIFLGGYYYLSKSTLRPYIGSQIGLAYAESNEYGIINGSNELVFEPAFNPIISVGGGLDYVVKNRLDLTIECRQIFGKHIANSYSTYLDEFRVSIGVSYYLINRTTN